MLRTLIKKELLGNLTSLRFMLTFLLVIFIFLVSGFIFSAKHKAELSDHNTITNSNMTALKNEATALNLVPYHIQTIHKKPLVAQLMCEGFEKSLPNTFRLDVFSINYPEVESRLNFLFPRFADIDWAFIIAFILSFVAVLMTFDSFSAEKERGTLGLMMSNSLPRDKVIIGKYVSGMLTISIPLLTGILVNTLIVSLSGIPLLRNGFWLNVLAFLVLSLLYLSFFVLTGILVSSLSSRSSTSIVILLFIWVLVVIIVPALGRVAAEKFVDVPTRSEVDRQIEDARKQIWANSSKFGANAGSWGSGVTVNPPARTALFNAITESRNQYREDYLNKIMAQVNAGRFVTRLSPTSLYQNATEAMIGTGVSRFKHLYQQLKNYQRALKDFLTDKDREDPESMHLLAEWIGHRVMFSSKPVDFNDIPKFEERQMTKGEGIRIALWDIGFLAVLNLLFCVTVYAVFLRADVRQT